MLRPGRAPLALSLACLAACAQRHPMQKLREEYRALFSRAGGFPLDAGDAERYLADVDQLERATP